MHYLFILPISALVLAFIYYSVIRGKMEYRLIIHHRDFLKSIKIDSVDKIKNSWVYGEGKYVMFSIEIDGERRRYDTLFTDTKTIESLNDKELLFMHNKLKRARLAVLTIFGVCIILLVC